MRQSSSTTIAVVLALGATTLGAQQIATAPCTKTVYNGAVTASAVDTSVHPVRVNVGGGSKAITDQNVNNAQSKKTRTTNAQVDRIDSSKTDIPAVNSERTAARANVGGGSVAQTRVNDAGSRKMPIDRTPQAGDVVAVDCPPAAPVATSTTTSSYSQTSVTSEPVAVVDSIKSHTSSTYHPGTRIVTDTTTVHTKKSTAKKSSKKKSTSPTKKSGSK